jgi:hypothetical protein
LEALTLLRQATAAGLIVRAEGTDLVVQGPKRAERIAIMLLDHKPTVMKALAKLGLRARAQPTEWQVRHGEALAFWRGLRPEDLAVRIAWGEMVNRWHKLYGERHPPWRCAGCGDPIGDMAVLSLSDGCNVHLNTLACLISYGERWRNAATRALIAMGLKPPDMGGRE